MTKFKILSLLLFLTSTNADYFDWLKYLDTTETPISGAWNVEPTTMYETFPITKTDPMNKDVASTSFVKTTIQASSGEPTIAIFAQRNGRTKERKNNIKVSCPSIFESPDYFSWPTGFLENKDNLINFTENCKGGSEKSICKITPKIGSICDLESKNGLWYSLNDDDEWSKTKGFICKKSKGNNSNINGTATAIWIEKHSNDIGPFNIKCHSKGCMHPSKLFDDNLINLADRKVTYQTEMVFDEMTGQIQKKRINGTKSYLNLSDTSARINFERNGFWECFGYFIEQNRNQTINTNYKKFKNANLAKNFHQNFKFISKNEYVPTGGYCQLKCANNEVRDLKSKLICRDQKFNRLSGGLDNESVSDEENLPNFPWQGLGKLNKELNHKRWSLRKYKKMTFSDGYKRGWRCYGEEADMNFLSDTK